jgi:hypothetical protein
LLSQPLKDSLPDWSRRTGVNKKGACDGRAGGEARLVELGLKAKRKAK